VGQLPSAGPRQKEGAELSGVGRLAGCIEGSLLFRLPDISARLRQADVGQDAADKLARHLRGVHGPEIEGWNHRENHCAGFGGQRHVAQMNAIKGRFADAEQQRPALLEGHVAAREIRELARPLAMAARVPIEQGRTIMPFDGWLPEAMAAPISESESCTVLVGGAPSSFSSRLLRPLRPNSSASTRNEFQRAQSGLAPRAYRLREPAAVRAQDCAGCAGECDG